MIEILKLLLLLSWHYMHDDAFIKKTLIAHFLASYKHTTENNHIFMHSEEKTTNNIQLLI